MNETQRAHAALDELEAETRKAIANLRAALEAIGASAGPDAAGSDGRGPFPLAVAPLVRERLLTPDSMEVGGWVRLPGWTPDVWRQIKVVDECDCDLQRGHHVRMWFRGISRPGHVAAHDTFPYLSDADFQADADREQEAV